MILSQRALNRATLHRQLLLERAELATGTAVHQLAGLNAQDRPGPELMLRSRLSRTEPLLDGRSLVRAPMLRATQHVVTAADYLAWRPLLQPVLSRTQRAGFGRATAGVDLAALAATAAQILASGPLTRSELAQRLSGHWPDHDAKALASSVQFLLPVVHPPSGARTTLALASDWLGSEVKGTTPQALIARYLAAFGPASVRDMQAWSGLTRLNEPVEEMDLVRHKDGDGVDLYDLPDLTLPDPDTPAPLRLLTYADNLLVSHADRRRVMDPEVQAQMCVGALIKPAVLIDGRVAGTWLMVDGEPVVEWFGGISADVSEEAAWMTRS